MRVRRFVWDAWNREHVARHGVTEEEVEGVFLSRPEIRAIGAERYTAHGTSLDGRYLLLVFERLSGDAFYPITARDLALREQRNFRKRRKT